MPWPLQLPEWTPISRLVEDGETPLFKQNFAVWPESMSMPGMDMAPGTRKSKFVKKVFDPNSMVAKKERESMRMPKEEEGSGKSTVWRVENIKDLVSAVSFVICMTWVMLPYVLYGCYIYIVALITHDNIGR